MASFASVSAAAQAPPENGPAGLQTNAAASEKKPEEHFDVWEYRVLGNDVLPQRDVERAIYGLLGPQKTIADVEKARQALEMAYRTAGYSTVFVDIPEQTVSSGVVRLQVTEGHLDRVRVTGARYFSNRQILASLPSLQSGEVPHFPDVQKQLTALNRVTADRSVTPVLRAGRFPGTVDVELRVKDDLPLHGNFEINDRYTADTTKTRANLGLSYANLWQKAHTFSLQYQFAPEQPSDAKVVAATYVAPLANSGDTLAFYAVKSSSDVATVGTLSVIGNGKIFGVRGILPFASIGKFAHNLTLGLDFKDFQEDIRLTADNGVDTPIQYVNWSATYGFSWAFPKSVSSFSLGADWGVRGLGNDDAEFENKRFMARANYAYLIGTVQHSRQVFGAARFVTRLNWQYTTAPLINNEQFAAGGADSVRGYLEAERLADVGASLNLELHSPSLANGPHVKDLELFGFFDVAGVETLDPLPSQDARYRLSGTGIGLHFAGFGGMDAELEWARALRDGANVLKGDDRIHFRLMYAF